MCSTYAGVSLVAEKTGCLIPFGMIAPLREVVLLVGDGRPLVQVLAGLYRRSRELGLPTEETQGPLAPSLIKVWREARSMSPRPLFFTDESSFERVDPGLLAEVRAQTLVTCTCGAFCEVSQDCSFCAVRDHHPLPVRTIDVHVS